MAASASASVSEKKIALKSCDDEAFEVEAVVAMESQTLRHMIEDDCAESEIPIPNVTGKILAKVIVYCKKHAEAGVVSTGVLGGKITTEDLKDLNAWDEEFIKVDRVTLFDIVLAANYLNIKSLLDLGCMQIANMMRGKNVEEIRETFGIKNDYTREEEEELKRENQWAFE